MTTTINADNGVVSGSAGLKSSADSSGVLALQTNGTTAVSISTGQVATFTQAPVLPAASIPQAALAAGVAGNGPAFSAYLSADQSFSPSTNTKVCFNTEEFDTNSNYDSTTNYRFTPTVAGYYLITSKIYIAATGGGMTSASATLWKNGSAFKGGSTIYTPTYAIGHFSCVVSAIIYMNGSSDYAEIYGNSTGTSLYFIGNATDSYFQASMVRSA